MRLRLPCTKPSISHHHLQATSLGPPHGDCGNTTLHWYRGVHYSRARCNRDCEVTQLLDACNCTNFYMPGNAPTGKHDMDIPKHFRTPLKYHNGLQFYVRNLVQAWASPSHLLAQKLGCSTSNALISFFFYEMTEDYAKSYKLCFMIMYGPYMCLCIPNTWNPILNLKK